MVREAGPAAPGEAAPPGVTTVVVGLSKIALALKHKTTNGAMPRGLSPTQAQVLATLRAHAPEGGMRLAAIAEALAVTPATASDAVSSLEHKRLVTKARSRDDARALAIALTPAGAREADAAAAWPDFLQRAVAELSPGEQEVFVVGLVKMIRALQERGEIPVARMCTTCTHFQPDAHPGARAPHHCAFVDAPFGASELRLDCADHARASAEKQAADWARFLAGDPSGLLRSPR